MSMHRRSILMEAKRRKDKEKMEEESRRAQRMMERKRLLEMAKNLSLDMKNDGGDNERQGDGSGSVGEISGLQDDNDGMIVKVSRMRTCLQCNIEVRESMLPTHMTEQCTHRLILCPNYANGCKQRFIVLHKVQHHLMHECQVEKHRDDMVAKSKHRRGRMII